VLRHEVAVPGLQLSRFSRALLHAIGASDSERPVPRRAARRQLDEFRRTRSMRHVSTFVMHAGSANWAAGAADGWSLIRELRESHGHSPNCQHVAPFGSAVLKPMTVQKVNR
jgi:hypothetical protein